MRAFLAVDPDEGLRNRLEVLLAELRRSAAEAGNRPRITWVKAAVVHLTVKFLGEFPEDRASALRAELEMLLRSHRPVTIPLQRLGAFPAPQAPRVLWLGPLEGWERGAEAHALLELVARIDECCARHGVERDRQPWRPHLTLARIRSGERDVGRTLAARHVFDRLVVHEELRVDAISLIKSDLRQEGPVHVKLWTERMAGG